MQEKILLKISDFFLLAKKKRPCSTLILKIYRHSGCACPLPSGEEAKWQGQLHQAVTMAALSVGPGPMGHHDTSVPPSRRTFDAWGLKKVVSDCCWNRTNKAFQMHPVLRVISNTSILFPQIAITIKGF